MPGDRRTHGTLFESPPGQAPGRLAAAARRWGLTPRQGEVVALAAGGLSNRAIADALGCAEGTVELHVTAVLRKAGCRSRTELVARFWSEP